MLIINLMKWSHFMKILRCFSLVFIYAIAVSMPLEGMKRQREIEKIELRCQDSDTSITVPASIVQHSVTLSTHLKKFPLSAFYPIPVEVADQEVLQVIVDCLTIIDSAENVSNRLLEYVYNLARQHTQQMGRDLFRAQVALEIQQLSDCFKAYPAYAKKKVFDLSDQRLDEVLQKALVVFEKIEDKNNSAIVIDIDDTALTRAKSFGMIQVNGTETCFPYYSALEKVFLCYKKIVAMGFKIFFLTARVEKTSNELSFCDGYEATASNLKEEGYDVFEEIICVQHDAYFQMKDQSKEDIDLFVDLLAEWKARERNRIAKKFTIVGTLDDTEENLKGENVGHAVLIPRFC